MGPTFYYYSTAKLSIAAIFSVFVIIFYTVWLVKVIKHFFFSLNMYKVNRNKDFRDTREQDRILYNYETQIVNDIILVFVSFGEISEILIVFLSAITTVVESKKTFHNLPIVKAAKHCELINILFEIFQNLRSGSPVEIHLTIVQDTVASGGYILILLTLSFLTEYLSKRYYQQPSYTSILKHFIIFLIQTTILVICSNEQLFIFQIIIAPILVLIDWCILVRNSRKLRNVLKSNVRDLSLHFTNRFLYWQQLRLLRIYTVYIPILLTALFFGLLALLFHHYLLLLNIALSNYCTPSIFPNLETVYVDIFYNLQNFGTLLLMLTHFLLLGLPMYIISIQMVVIAFVKKIRRNKEIYRYNYTNFHNLHQHNLRCPY